MGVYVNYGCGTCAPPGWINFDASPTLRLERVPGAKWLLGRRRVFPDNVRYGDIADGLPVAKGSCAGIYASHVIEHLPLEGARIALANSLTYLQPGGLLRVVVPDLRALASRYLENPADSAAHEFMRDSCLGRESRAVGIGARLREHLGNSAHLWMWDARTLCDLARHAGFASVRTCGFADSADPKFSEVEEPGRFVNAVAIECVGPA